MQMRKLALAAIAFAILAAATVLAVGTSAGSAKSNGVFKAAWIYVGPHNDGGWSQAHDQGRLYDGGFSATDWSQLAVTGTVWLLLPLAFGLWRVLRAEVK